MSNLVLRTITAVVGVPLIIVVLYVGDWWFAAVVALAALAAQHEIYGLFELGGATPARWYGLALGLLAALSVVLPWAPSALLLGVLLLIAQIPFKRDDRPLTNTAATLLGVIYPATLMSYLTHLRLARGPSIEDAEAFLLTLTVFVLIWASDTFAYFVGRAVGRHPLAPRVSPKKTWEGAIGGAIGALAVAVLLRITLIDFLAWPHVVAVALICGAFGQLGDLAESWMKRAAGAKDSGNMLPGHGGILDRVDALILAAPLVYVYLELAGVVGV